MLPSQSCGTTDFPSGKHMQQRHCSRGCLRQADVSFAFSGITFQRIKNETVKLTGIPKPANSNLANEMTGGLIVVNIIFTVSKIKINKININYMTGIYPILLQRSRPLVYSVINLVHLSNLSCVFLYFCDLPVCNLIVYLKIHFHPFLKYVQNNSFPLLFSSFRLQTFQLASYFCFSPEVQGGKSIHLSHKLDNSATSIFLSSD